MEETNRKDERVDRFAKFLMREIRDFCLARFEELASASTYSPTNEELRESLKRFSDSDLIVIRKIIMVCIDDTISEMLSTLEYPEDKYKGLSIAIDGTDITEIESDLQVLLHADWIERWSEYEEYE